MFLKNCFCGNLVHSIQLCILELKLAVKMQLPFKNKVELLKGTKQ